MATGSARWTPQGAPAAPRPSLYAQVRLARIWLPLAVVGMVLVYQLVVVPLGGPTWRFWSQLLFYSLLGPSVMYLVLTWIASEVRSRELAQIELQRLYRELQDSHAVLGALQRVTEQFAAAPDLEHAVAAATRGVREVTGARGAAVVVGSGVVAVDVDPEFGAFSPDGLEQVARRRDTALQQAVASAHEAAEDGSTLLSLAIRWGGRHEGSLHAAFPDPPAEKQRETLRILAADFAAAAEAVQGRTRDLITLFEVDRSIRAEGNLARLLSALITKMAMRVEARAAGVYLRDEDDSLELRAAVRLEPGDRGLRPVPLRLASAPVRVNEGPIGRAAAGTEPVVLHELGPDEREQGGPILREAVSAMVLPLVTEDSAVGVIVLSHPAGGHFDEASLPFLGVLASQVSLAVGNANAYRQSEELAIAEERARIAREIHDGVAQSLAFTALKLDLVARMLTRDTDLAERELQAAKTTIREMIREVRRSIFALRTVDLERHGFAETLRRYALDFGQQNDVAVELDIAPLPELSVKSEAVLFRIFQEAMNNVAKHAQATRVVISVGPDARGQVRVQVQDDGRGFDLEEVGDRVTSAGGLGLRQMRERVEARGGSLAIDSDVGSGTTITATVPV
jgi:signal transduction histidine kinase